MWVGLKASVQERRQALSMAATYLKKYGRPLDTPISKVLEGGENELFEVCGFLEAMKLVSASKHLSFHSFARFFLFHFFRLRSNTASSLWGKKPFFIFFFHDYHNVFFSMVQNIHSDGKTRSKVGTCF